MLPDDEPEILSPIDIQSLLRHAWRRLDAEDADQTDYRRAVSDAFYALYHALTLAAVPFIASDDPLEPYRRLRDISHPRMRAVAGEMLGSMDARVRWVARVLLDIYGWRTAADYNHLKRFTYHRAEDLIDLAAAAVATVAAPDFGDAFPRALATRA